MAMSVVYATINGQIVSENRGGVISYYAPDNLGSTVALLDSTGTVTDTFTYWPYGEIQSHVGSSITPFTFCGTLGYYTDVLGSQTYVRARYLIQGLTRWLTTDPLWPMQLPYAYVENSPTLRVDPFGLGTTRLPLPDPVSPAGGVWTGVLACILALMQYLISNGSPVDLCVACLGFGVGATVGSILGSGGGSITGGVTGGVVGGVGGEIIEPIGGGAPGAAGGAAAGSGLGGWIGGLLGGVTLGAILQGICSDTPGEPPPHYYRCLEDGTGGTPYKTGTSPTWY